MKTLVLVEHDNKSVRDATLATVTAAAKLGEVHLLVAGSGCRAVAEEAADRGERRGEVDRAGRDEGAELAERVARDHRRPRGHARLVDRPKRGHGDRQDGRLGVVGVLERLVRP